MMDAEKAEQVKVLIGVLIDTTHNLADTSLRINRAAEYHLHKYAYKELMKLLGIEPKGE